MRVTIVLPAYYRVPIGGYHVHYTYANRLVERGHRVTIVFPRYLHRTIGWLRGKIWAVRMRRRYRPLLPTFALDKRVRVMLTPDLEGSSLPAGDVLIATAWQAAEALRHAPERAGRKHFVVYDYEYWQTAAAAEKARIAATFDGTFRLMATSSAVAAMIEQCGGEVAALVPCGMDLERYHAAIAPAVRSGDVVAFQARAEPFKGLDDIVAALEVVRERRPGLRAACFGGTGLPVPDWVHYRVRPTDAAVCALYNEATIFVCASHHEGWGLPGLEAMACGAALLTTDTGGSRDYAEDGINAVVVPPQDRAALIAGLERLLDDPALRINLAERGMETAARFSWDSATDQLLSFLQASGTTPTNRPHDVSRSPA